MEREKKSSSINQFLFRGTLNKNVCFFQTFKVCTLVILTTLTFTFHIVSLNSFSPNSIYHTNLSV